MKYLIILTLFSLAISCSLKEKTKFTVDNCGNERINVEGGFELSDSLNYFSIQIPDSSWKPEKTLYKKQSGITIGNNSFGYLQVIDIIQSNYKSKWDWDKQQSELEKQVHVVEKGFINILNKDQHYSIILDEENDNQKFAFMNITILDTLGKKHFSLNLTTEFSNDYRCRLKEMLPIIRSFKIKK